MDKKNKNDFEKIKYKIQKNYINLYLTDKDKKSEFVIYSYNNIISLNIELNLSMVNSLIELYIFQENLKLKLKQNKKEKIEMKLVDREWISHFKSHYSYNTMCDLIKNSKFIRDKIKNYESINYSDKLCYLNEVSKDLRENFLDDLLFNLYLKKEDKKKKYELSYKKEKVEYKTSTKEVSYIDNFEFVDSKLLQQLIESNINNKEKIGEISKYVECHIFGDKLLIVYENNSKNNLYISGYINNENLFISEYLFDYLNIEYIERKDSSDIFKILKNNVNKNYIDLTGVDNQSVVHCFKLKSDESQNINNSYLEKGEEETKGNIQLNEKENEKNCKKAIEALIELYLMNKDLKTKLNESLSKNFEKEQCYLIKEDWFSKYKEIYLYNKINEYLSSSSIQRENISSKTDKIINEIYNKYKDEFLKKLVNDKGEFVTLQNDNNNFNVEFKLREDKNEIIFLYKYFIINEKIFNIITNNDSNTGELDYL